MDAFSRTCERLHLRFHVFGVSKPTLSGESEVTREKWRVTWTTR